MIATEADIPHILELGEKFHALSPWRDRPYVPEDVERTLRGLMVSDQGALLYNGSGILGGVLSPIFFGGGVVAQELFWFAEANGRELLEAFEAWAKESGADCIMMAHLTMGEDADARMKQIYEKRGYALRETHFYKGLD